MRASSQPASKKASSASRVNSATPDSTRVNSYACFAMRNSRSIWALIHFPANEPRVVEWVFRSGPHSEVATAPLVVRAPQDSPGVPSGDGTGPALRLGVLDGSLDLFVRMSCPCHVPCLSP